MVYRRTERSEQTRLASRAALLSAAGALLLEQGYQATTMQDVVKRANTSIGNAYFYFRNKEELFAEVLRQVIDSTWAETERLASTAPVGPKRIALMLYANLTSILGPRREFAKVIADVQERMRYLKEKSLAQWVPTFRECCPWLSAEDAELAAGALWGANRMMSERSLNGVIDRTPQEIAAFSIRWNLRALGFADPEIDQALAYAQERLDGSLSPTA